MSRISIDLDDELLEKASKLFGTKTTESTVHATLMDVVGRHECADFVAWLAAGALPDLSDPAIIERAWK